MDSVKVKNAEEKAFEQLLSFSKKIEKDLLSKKKIIKELTELNSQRKENLNNLYKAKVISLDIYKKVKYDYEHSLQLMENFIIEYSAIEEKLQLVKIKLNISKPEKKSIGKVHELSKFRRKTS